MQLSIVIVSWNTRELLDAALDSIFAAQAEIALEVIVVDNASTDGSPEMVEEKYPDARVLRNSENLGFAQGNNQGFKFATAPYVLLLNTDTLIHGDVLQKSVQYLVQNANVSAMGCRVLNADGTTQMTCSMFPTLTNLLLELTGLAKLAWPHFLGRYHYKGWRRDSEKEVDVISGCYFMIRRTVIQQIGGLDESFFFFGEETDWCMQIKRSGGRTMFAPVGEITHFGGGSAKRLDYKRDLLLADGLVRFHVKNYGLVSAMLVSIIILCFSISRSLFWTAAAVLHGSERACERARHFRGLLRAGGTVWPGLRRDRYLSSSAKNIID